MVQWEKQIEDRSVPAWRDKYVAYARLKRKLDQLKVVKKSSKARHMTEIPHSMSKALDSGDDPASAYEAEAETPIADDEQLRPPRGVHWLLGSDDVAKQGSEKQERLLDEDQERRKQDEFLEEVHKELDRVSEWYRGKVTALEARVKSLTQDSAAAGAGGVARTGFAEGASEEIPQLHLEAVQLTDYVLLNVEALRKIVKKMDKQCGTSYQKIFVEQHLKQSPLAAPGNIKEPFNGERARMCRRRLEQAVSPERLQEMRSRAMAAGTGVGLSKLDFRPRRVLASLAFAAAATPLATLGLPGAPRAQRCVALVAFTVSMWVSEAAPFEATAMLVPPLAVLLGVLEGSKEEQAKRVLAAVFNDSLYLVLAGFVISSVFSRCQLDARAAAQLQRSLGGRPFLFLLAIMFLGVGLSALLSNVTAPLLLVEVLKPLLRDLPTDSRYSRALLLGLAFSCNIGGMMTPISSPQNIAALATLKLSGGDISWAQWLAVSIPFCSVAVLLAWALLLVVYRFDRSPGEAARDAEAAAVGARAAHIPAVVFEKEELTPFKVAALTGASATLGAFACAPVAALFGGTSSVAVFYVALSLGTGVVSRPVFNSYNWHLLFLIGGGSALGLAVRESGLLGILTSIARRGLSSDPFFLVAELVAVLVGATTFVSHTVAALVLMPLVVELGMAVGEANLAVLVGALACSAACALPMTSFPNVNSLMAVDDNGKPWLSMRHFLVAGAPMTALSALLLASLGFWLASLVI